MRALLAAVIAMVLFATPVLPQKAVPFRLTPATISFGHVKVGGESATWAHVCNGDSFWHTIQTINLVSDRPGEASNFVAMGFNPPGNSFDGSRCKDIRVFFRPTKEGLRAAKLVVVDEKSVLYETFLVGEGGDRPAVIIRDVASKMQ